MHQDYLVLGGAGLVGTQVVRHIVQALQPRRIVVASLLESEAQAACQRHEEEFGRRVSFVPAYGNLFVPADLATTPRGDLLSSRVARHRLLEAVYGDFDRAYEENHLVQLIRRYRPEVIIDAVNTATGFSYQDVFDGAAKVRERIGPQGFDADGVQDLEALLLSLSVPQLTQHVRFLQRATEEYQTQIYLKVGTTGTGGMGLNIPYTHSEDKPSRKLLAKNEAAFGHTGLLFLLARTPGAPIVKEVKPAAMIGYRAVTVKQVTDKHGNGRLFQPQTATLEAGGSLDLSEPDAGYEPAGRLELPVVDTGENGVFTRGEFAAITALGQMEYITPEEIARCIVLELRGASTGRDIISALDASVLAPTYKAGLVRGVALRDLEAEEARHAERGGIPSIALGRLGPPELSKLLFEAALLSEVYGSTDALLSSEESDETMAERLVAALESSAVWRAAPSIGIPVLLPDGQTILRGPKINVPEFMGLEKRPLITGDAVDDWARKGWVDLRPSNLARWRDRIQTMSKARADLRHEGSAAASHQSFMSDRFEIGEMVAWIFNNEMQGYRMK